MSISFLFSLFIACGSKEVTEPSTEPSTEPTAEPTAEPTIEPDVDADGDGYFEGDDCDDTDPTVYPDAVEICDDLDNNCDGSKDEGLALILSYADGDADGFGNSEMMLEDCEVPEGYVQNMYDCDDSNASIGSSEQDMDCDGILDSEDDDMDGDGVLGVEDCDDADANILQNIDSVETIITDEDGDGIPENIKTYTYDANGRMDSMSEVYDLSGNGATDDEIYSAYTYNTDGNLSIANISYDFGMDGTAEISYVLVLSYNTNGDVTSAVGNGTRIDGTTFSYSYTYVYDSAYNLTSTIFNADWTGSGTTEQSSLETYTYDPVSNKMTGYTLDQLNGSGDSLIDGVAEETHTYTYDANGKFLTQYLVFDEDSDGTTDETYYFEFLYNPNSGLLDSYTVNRDWDADGTTDAVYVYTYTYNTDDLVTREEMAVTYTLSIYTPYNYTMVTTYTYTPEGKLLVTEIDEDNDGVVDITYTNAYNASNQLISSQDADGSYTYTYAECPQ